MPSTYLKNTRNAAYSYKVMENPMVLRSIIFDCDGVLMDSEPVHFSALKKVLGPDGHILTDELYKERYLAMDDRGVLKAFYQDINKPINDDQLHELMEKKSLIFKD